MGSIVDLFGCSSRQHFVWPHLVGVTDSPVQTLVPSIPHTRQRMDALPQELSSWSQIIGSRFLLGPAPRWEHRGALVDFGVTHILNLTCTDGITHPSITCKRIAVTDESTTDLSAHFLEAHAFMADALSQPSGKLLVHCAAGVSRSATMVISFLMRHGLDGSGAVPSTLKEAYSHVLECRPVVSPNTGFFEQLLTFDESLHGRRSMSSAEYHLKVLQSVFAPDPKADDYPRRIKRIEEVYAQFTGDVVRAQSQLCIELLDQ